MAIGDDGVIVGLTKYAATQDKRLGYQNDNQRADDIAAIMHYVVLTNNAPQALATGGTGAAVAWQTELSDKFAMHSSGANTQIVCKKAGLYQFDVRVYVNSTTGVGTLFGRVNGSFVIPGSADRRAGAAGAGTPLFSSFTYDLAVNDYVEIMVIESVASGSIPATSDQYGSLLTARRLGPA